VEALLINEIIKTPDFLCPILERAHGEWFDWLTNNKRSFGENIGGRNYEGSITQIF